MPTSIAAQLYTVRAFTRTPADISRTLARIRRIGYEAVQCSGLGPVAPEVLARMLREEGLVCCATHTPLERLRDEPEKVIDEHRLWGCRYTALGIHKPIEPGAGAWQEFCETYNRIAERFEGSGLSLGYHHHSHELARLGQRTALHLLLERLHPSIWIEIDTYWLAHGGADPAAWIRSAAGRVPCVHLKDMAITPERQQFMADVGEGNLNWPEVLRACREARVEWYIVEQDTCPGDPFESLAISLRNLKKMGTELYPPATA